MKIEKIAIIFDTNIFGEKSKYNFSSLKLLSFVKKVKNISNIQLFMPSIVMEEIRKHIKDSLRNDKLNRKSKYFEDNLPSNFYEKVLRNTLEKFDDFIIENEIEIIECNEYLDIKQVNEWYFNMHKPFEESKPKEFPDAMIVSAMINYFQQHNYDKCFVLSADKGFKAAIEQNSDMKVFNEVNEVMKEIFDFDEKEINEMVSGS